MPPMITAHHLCLICRPPAYLLRGGRLDHDIRLRLGLADATEVACLQDRFDALAGPVDGGRRGLTVVTLTGVG